MAHRSDTCISKRTGQGLEYFFSKDDADHRAYHLNSRLGGRLVPYNCNKCYMWHLSPEDRQTPNTICQDCTDREGSKKALYETRASAAKRAGIIQSEKGLLLEVYECPFSNGWHLTKG